jgi:hypothetical protein
LGSFGPKCFKKGICFPVWEDRGANPPTHPFFCHSGCPSFTVVSGRFHREPQIAESAIGGCNRPSEMMRNGPKKLKIDRKYDFGPLCAFGCRKTNSRIQTRERHSSASSQLSSGSTLLFDPKCCHNLIPMVKTFVYSINKHSFTTHCFEACQICEFGVFSLWSSRLTEKTVEWALWGL